MKKQVIATDKAPKAIGPYSAAMKIDELIYTSGQLGIDPATNEIVDGGVEAETRQALLNMQAILNAANSKLDLVVKTTVFLRDINDFGKMNVIYGEFFKENPPARSAFQVGALPKGAAVEIEAVAITLV